MFSNVCAINIKQNHNEGLVIVTIMKRHVIFGVCTTLIWYLMTIIKDSHNSSKRKGREK